jgi:hypothetical protein
VSERDWAIHFLHGPNAPRIHFCLVYEACCHDDMPGMSQPYVMRPSDSRVPVKRQSDHFCKGTIRRQPASNAAAYRTGVAAWQCSEHIRVVGNSKSMVNRAHWTHATKAEVTRGSTRGIFDANTCMDQPKPRSAPQGDSFRLRRGFRLHFGLHHKSCNVNR